LASYSSDNKGRDRPSPDFGDGSSKSCRRTVPIPPTISGINTARPCLERKTSSQERSSTRLRRTLGAKACWRSISPLHLGPLTQELMQLSSCVTELMNGDQGKDYAPVSGFRPWCRHSSTTTIEAANERLRASPSPVTLDHGYMAPGVDRRFWRFGRADGSAGGKSGAALDCSRPFPFVIEMDQKETGGGHFLWRKSDVELIQVAPLPLFR
jgi:hypothetical protein